MELVLFLSFLRKSGGEGFKDFKELKDLKKLGDKGHLGNKKNPPPNKTFNKGFFTSQKKKLSITHTTYRHSIVIPRSIKPTTVPD